VRLVVESGLLLTTLEIQHQSKTLLLNRVLVDTGSAGTLLSTERLLEIDLSYSLEDTLLQIRGVGGIETVFSKSIEQIRLGQKIQRNFVAQVGEMNYGFALDGILGLDFMMQTGAIINLQRLEMNFA
jgi:hypothetical protein